MPPKKKRGRGGDDAEDAGRTLQTRGGTVMCHLITPGPKYRLKTLVGYKDHCISMYRNPAYTFGDRRITIEVIRSPGPKYKIEERKTKGFTFGYAAKYSDETIGPGPKYKSPDITRGPFFSIKWRTNLRKIDETPGPYYVKPIADAPAFFMGHRTAVGKPIISAGPYSYGLNTVKPKAPVYTIASRREFPWIAEGPGPIYALRPSKPTPAFSFGVKHSECAPPYITNCDKQC